MPRKLYVNSQSASTSPSKLHRLRVRDDKRKKKRWRIEYDLIYDGGYAKWKGYYTTLMGAKLAAMLHVKLGSWGGNAVLFDQSKGE